MIHGSVRRAHPTLMRRAHRRNDSGFSSIRRLSTHFSALQESGGGNASCLPDRRSSLRSAQTPDAMVLETCLLHGLRLILVAAIEDHRILHERAHALIVRMAARLPFRDQPQRADIV